MTVFDNVAYGLRLKRVSAEAVRARVRAALELVAIGDGRRRRGAAQAGGALRRPAAARGAGPGARASSRACSCSTSRSAISTPRCASACASRCGGCSSASASPPFYVTHDQEEALAIADRVVLMNAGRVIQTGTPEDVYLDPRASLPRTSSAWAIASRRARKPACSSSPASASRTRVRCAGAPWSSSAPPILPWRRARRRAPGCPARSRRACSRRLLSPLCPGGGRRPDGGRPGARGARTPSRSPSRRSARACFRRRDPEGEFSVGCIALSTWPGPATPARCSRAAPRAGPSAAASRRGAAPARDGAAGPSAWRSSSTSASAPRR